MTRALKILVAGPESDAHAVAPKLLEWALEEQGYTVCNLGVCCPAVKIAQTVADLAMDGSTVVVFLCCQNGHGLRDLADLPAYLEMLSTPDVHLFAGGRLAVGAETDPDSTRAAYRALGITPLESFDEAFSRLAQLKRQCPERAPTVSAPLSGGER